MRALRSVAGLALRPLQLLCYLLSGFVPRDPRRWTGGTWAGQRFADNTAALFLHCAGDGPVGIEMRWVTARRAIRDDLRGRGLRAHTRWSPAGMWWCLRSGVHVYDSLPHDTNFWLTRGARLVLLRHGIGMKKIERAIDAPGHRLHELFHGNALARLAYGIALPWHLPVPDLVTACSEEHADQAVRYFGVARDAVVLTGFPRHDRLADAGPPDRRRIPTVDAPVPAERPVFVYMPTFRESLTRETFDWASLEVAAEAAGVIIAVKLHLVDATRGVRGHDRVVASPWLRMIDPGVDPIDVFVDADGLITDYSSAGFDFLLLDRPILYYVPDATSFEAQRPLAYTLEEVAAGPICTDRDELCAALREAAVEGVGRYAALHRRQRARFHQVPPGGASARVADAIVAMTARSPGGATRRGTASTS